jgi:glycosyltransferase involved in cell wall biosynthesis
MIISKKKTDLSVGDTDFPVVDVLLAIHNGSKFIREQLDSLVTQRDVKINLFVGFDDVDEDSEAIITELKSGFQSIKRYYFLNVGVDENFSRLLQESRSKYIATCDQDDIWLEDHLIKSIRLMIPDHPSLIFSQLAEFSSESTKVRIWPILKKNQIPSFSIFENVARGCTQVMNSHARDLILSVVRPHSIPRDWWFYSVVHHRDGVRFLPEVTVKYRLHESNLIGADRRFRRRLSRFSKNKLHRSFTIAGELRFQFRNYPSTNSSKKLNILVEGLDGSFFTRLKVTFCMKEKFRSDFLMDIVLRAILFFSERGNLRNNRSNETK